jgi:deoxyribodipyrimidine photo-lyase
MSRKQHPTPVAFQCHIVTDLEIRRRTRVPLLQELTEIPIEHRGDRASRQSGGESEAQTTLQSFLYQRGAKFSSGISSPVTSWSSYSRPSAHFTWGHISVRRVHHAIKARQAQIKEQKGKGQSLSSGLTQVPRCLFRRDYYTGTRTLYRNWKRNQCSRTATSVLRIKHLRRRPGDWNESYYLAWATGTTGFPFVDACMRSLDQHGWLNLRMRAMNVSFASYNL